MTKQAAEIHHPSGDSGERLLAALSRPRELRDYPDTGTRDVMHQ